MFRTAASASRRLIDIDPEAAFLNVYDVETSTTMQARTAMAFASHEVSAIIAHAIRNGRLVCHCCRQVDYAFIDNEQCMTAYHGCYPATVSVCRLDVT